ncbi:hypothetical protein HP439_12075 [Sphingobacterium shayense]|uniref:transposase n=1 Tax=Sphingobacterium shayense TaxID=626343 RepID=UPI001554A07A|nr:transposase [Sphingobacterium shayense]NQD71461.1 hypothetical protein [Sphingobacterium shayense]
MSSSGGGMGNGFDATTGNYTGEGRPTVYRNGASYSNSWDDHKLNKNVSVKGMTVEGDREVYQFIDNNVRSRENRSSTDFNRTSHEQKPVYKAVNKEMAYENLLVFEEKWSKKCPIAAKSWLDNWVNLSTFFQCDEQDRRTIYTTNPIEGMPSQVRKITKSKGAFSSEQALMKLMFLIIKDISKKWTMPMHNWGLTISQLCIKFGDRLKLDRDF